MHGYAPTMPAPITPVVATVALPADQPAEDIEDELLIEEISIDGMCGVY